MPIIKGGEVAARRIVESGDRKAKTTWRGDLRDAAEAAMVESAFPMPAPDDALALTVVIVRKRPSAHLRTGRNAGVVKDWALGLRPTSRPDTTKLVRAIEDALTGILWRDDSQVVEHRLHKVFGDQFDGRGVEGVSVEVTLARPFTPLA